jgi:MFS family permease
MSTEMDLDSTIGPGQEEPAAEFRITGKPWMYKRIRIGPWKFPWFASPELQLILVSFVCFMCPGMFNALSGLGAGGQLSAHDVDNANTALYSTFAVVGFFAGSIANRIGLKLTLSIGGFGYFLYAASLLSYNHNKNVGFLLFAGALLGVCAGMLWCAQGAVMMSYPLESQKGIFIATFWVIFNLGGVIGSLVNSPKILCHTRVLYPISLFITLDSSRAHAV